jgi:two-component system, NarL family, response regulator YdfI
VTRVLVWAKSAITRAGLEAIVDADARFQIAGAVGRPPNLLSAVRDLEPDVILLDAVEDAVTRLLPDVSGQLAAPALVVLVDNVRRAEAVRLLQSGVRALILRESPPHEITAALQAASDGLAVISPEILDVLLPAAHEPGGEDDGAPEEPLTARESEVLALLAAGAGNKEIAAKLRISEHTAKFHVSSILGKLGASSRTEAVTRGYRQGLILI